EKVIKSGYLLKKGEKRRSWKRRWFVLKTTKLAMYKDNKEYKLLRVIDLNLARSIVHVTSKTKYKFMFAITTPKRTYYLQAQDEFDMEAWMATVQRRIDETPPMDYGSPTTSNFPKLTPVSIPKSTRTSDEHDLAVYSTSRSYPLSPNSQLHMTDGILSSDEEDADEYNWTTDMAHALQEESRNRVMMEGYLLKLGRNKGWRKRWFVLRQDTLAYYEDDKEYKSHRIIPLESIIDSLEIDPISKNKRYVFKIVILKRSYVVCASSEDERSAWLDALNAPLRRVRSKSSTLHKIDTEDSFEVTSHISGISGAGAMGGAGGALPGGASRRMVRGA
ncbi:hypothetical protein BX666DRAFT_1857195, partial [Dichotomocladium elegans]